MDFFNGVICQLFKDNFRTIIFMEKAYINGLMEEFLMEIGLIIKWMDLEYLLGVMVECKYIYYQYLFLVILVNIKKIKNMVTEIFNGLMVVNIKYFNIFNFFIKIINKYC